MNISLTFIRVFFVFICVLFLTTYTTTISSNGFTLTNFLIGIITGGALGAIIIGSDSIFKRFNLRSFNIAALGLFFGFLMGKALFLIMQTALDFTKLPISSEMLALVKNVLFLFTAYLG